jgi:RND superfamily putative drug exporter
MHAGIIRAMAGTGGAVTSAGIVFAATMSSFVFSDLRILGPIGTTTGLGLLFDSRPRRKPPARRTDWSRGRPYNPS